MNCRCRGPNATTRWTGSIRNWFHRFSLLLSQSRSPRFRQAHRFHPYCTEASDLLASVGTADPITTLTITTSNLALALRISCLTMPCFEVVTAFSLLLPETVHQERVLGAFRASMYSRRGLLST